MTFRHLEAFVQVAEKGGFTRAADALCLTQPTVSGQIKELEQEFGVALFRRLPRAVELTEAGSLFLPKARDLLRSRDALLEWGASYRGLLWGRLVVHASTIPGEYLLPAQVGRFKRSHPEITVSLKVHDSGEVLRLLRAGEAALGVVGRREEDSGLSFAPLWDDRIGLFCSSGAELPERLDAAALSTLPLVCREEGSGTRRAVEEALREFRLPPRDLQVIAEFGSSAAVKRAVLAGVGVGFLSDLSVECELRAGDLREVNVVGFPELRRQFYAAWDPQRPFSPASRRFLDDLLAAD